MKKTLVLGATPNPSRYAYLATQKLKSYGHEVIPMGIKKGEIDGIKIENSTPQYDINTEGYFYVISKLILCNFKVKAIIHSKSNNYSSKINTIFNHLQTPKYPQVDSSKLYKLVPMY